MTTWEDPDWVKRNRHRFGRGWAAYLWQPAAVYMAALRREGFLR